MVSTDAVKELRDETGISVMQCKKALEKSDGDKEKALVILRKHAVETAEKKAERSLHAGVIESYIHNNHALGVIVELSCETDFVSQNKDFIALARSIAMHIAAANPQTVVREALDAKSLETARSVFENEAKDKPAHVQKSVVEGKMESYFKEVVLLDQPYVKDQERTVRELIEEATQKFGEKIEVSRFIRFSLSDR